jgi:hypothetical protein
MRTISVPLILANLQDNGFHLLVEIVVFGEKHFAVVDTGASRSVFDLPLMQQHVSNLTSNEEQQAATIFSASTTLVGHINKLAIGKLKLTEYEAVALDLTSVSETYAQLNLPRISAIIGGDILMKFHCKIDYKNLVIRFYT